jgi:excisionase family DNA binding protein
MTVKKTAERIGISTSKLYQLASSRAIGFYRIGGKIVFTEEDINAYLASCRVQAVERFRSSPSPPTGILKHLSLRNQ